MATVSLTICPRCGGVLDAPIGASLGGRPLCSCTRQRKSSAAASATSSAASRVGLAAAGVAASANSGTFAAIGSPVSAATSSSSNAGNGTVDVYARELNRTGKEKICCVCGKDVTHHRRMKDGTTGRYWCYECGSKQPEHVQHAMDVPCPECHRRVAAVRLIKHHEKYICAACYARHTGAGRRNRLPVLFVVGIVLLAVVLYGLFMMNVL